MKSIIVAIMLVCMYAARLFPATFDECNSLGIYFGKSPDAIHQKIADYETKLKMDASDYYNDLAIGILYCALASSSDNHEEGAAQKGIDYTGKFLARDHDNPLALIYNGLGHGFIARDSGNPIVKMLEANNGIGICDKAVKNASGKPYEWNIRFMRANYFINLPSFFGKGETAVSDYKFMENEYNTNTNDNSIGGSMVAAYFYLGEAEKSKGDIDAAIVYWKKSVALNTRYSMDSYEARTAGKRLDTFSD